ncbi:polysulfide reductase NrfD [Helicobacter sp. 13S00482-2]|uniref:NrfD/PsrC family molybdoenzyme membrane anchor subunit n=1 Tax=Helicobacter sp. 13S00482-2 TaxID=1476200 RepID=UPI000BA64632|nr:NrfD/PsrC family molybdoenzyme membrane anchor subunit [Helicobacter sp. 13S00482-2]PAF54386.1 polysulfide reductase NrfD [Helicobacter sp. 13S00482-2]
MYDMILNTINTITPARPWGIDVPNYFWFTGSSAAAFIISSFAHVFGMKQYKPIAGFALLVAFVLLAAAPLNLIDDLKQPGRIFNFFMYGWENFPTSPMKWGVLLLISYPILILFEALVLYREYFVQSYEKTHSVFLKKIYKIVALGRMQSGIAAEEKDHKIGFILGAIGIPLALSVHGYTGYILGVTHGIALWHTPLMPILFLASAMVSGTGLLIVILPLFQRFFTDFGKVDREMLARLVNLLSWFIVIDLVIRFFWLTFAIPFNGEEKYSLMRFFGANLFEIISIEYVLCLFVPMLIGFIPKLRKNLFLSIFGAIICAIGVWDFRWNTVIGGESIGRTTPGLLNYSPSFFGQDSIVSVLSNWGVFIALLCIIMALFPWDKEMNKYYK